MRGGAWQYPARHSLWCPGHVILHRVITLRTGDWVDLPWAQTVSGEQTDSVIGSGALQTKNVVVAIVVTAVPFTTTPAMFFITAYTDAVVTFTTTGGVCSASGALSKALQTRAKPVLASA